MNEAGEKGLSVKKIARHVFNKNNSLFNEITFDDVYRQVAFFLNKNSKSAGSIIERTQARGVYRLNTSVVPRQLQFEFKDEKGTEHIGTAECDEDRSLSLF